MKNTDKQQSGQKDMHSGRADRGKIDKMEQERRRQQQADNQGSRQQGDWTSDMEGEMGRKPASERDRDYDPDGDRMGKGGSDDQMKR